MALARSWFRAVWLGDVAHGRRLARAWNEDAARIAHDHPGRFGVFAPVPVPDTDGSLAEIAYALDILKADGIGLMTSYDDRWLGDPSFAPVYEELNRRKAVVFVHPTVPVCCATILPTVPSFIVEVPTDTTRAITSLLLSGTLARFPDIRFVFPHGGGTVTVLAARITGLARMRKELAERIPAGAEPELAKLSLRYGPCRQSCDHGGADEARADVAHSLRQRLPVCAGRRDGDGPEGARPHTR